ncbi:RpiR Transcriptional regulators [Burkholderiaceae bacterium]
MNAKEQILSHFPQLTPRLRDAARFVVDHPNDVVTHSMRGLAETANIMPSTLSRLAQQVGYVGWPELKKAFISDLGLNQNGYSERAKKLANRSTEKGLVNELFETYVSNLEATQLQIEPKIKIAANILQKAKVVHVAGFRASFAIAFSLFYGYRLFRNSVELIDGHCGGLELQLRRIQKRDAVVIISFAPYSKESIAVLEAARHAHASVIALSDSSASPLALGADVSLEFKVSSPSFFPSTLAGTAASEALLEALVATGKNDVVKPIDEAEKHLIRSGAYLGNATL